MTSPSMGIQPRKADQSPPTPGYNGPSTTPLHDLRQSLPPTREEFEEFKGDGPSDSQRKIRVIDWSRIVLSLVLIAAGSAIVGCEGHALYTYNLMHLSDQWFLPLWPQHFDLRPSIGILIGGAVVILTSSLSLICALLPAVSDLTAPMHCLMQFSRLISGIVLSAFLLPHPPLHRHFFRRPRGRRLCHWLQRQPLQPDRQRHNRVVDVPMV